MEPDVIRLYASSPPPMEDGAEEEDDEFGDFGTFSAVPNSISFTEFETPTTFNQTQALTATSPPELLNNRAAVAYNHSSSNGAHNPGNELPKANGVGPASLPDASERTEMKKAVSGRLDLSVSAADCNGGGAEVLTNGFDVQGSPSPQNSVHSHIKGMSTDDTGGAGGSPQDDFADFAVFSDAEGRRGQEVDEDLDIPADGSWPVVAVLHDEHCSTEQGGVRSTNRTGLDPSASDSTHDAAVVPSSSSDVDRGSQRADLVLALPPSTCEAVCTNGPPSLNGGTVADRDESKDAAGCSENNLLPGAAANSEAGQSDEKGSGNDTETETETETSFGRPLSTDALEEYGDMSTTGSAPSPPLPGDTATPADDSQLAEDDEDFGDFGDAGSLGGQGFADFELLEVQEDPSQSQSSAPAQEAASGERDDDFGDFNSPKFHTGGPEGGDGGRFADFPASDSFGNFNSAEGGEGGAGWSAFGEEQQEVEEESWAAFGMEPSVAPPGLSREEVQEEEDWHESEAPAGGEESSVAEQRAASLSSRLEQLFLTSFPEPAARAVEEDVVSLKVLLEEGEEPEEETPHNRCWRDGVWTQLQDIHEALGLRYQWGGSHCNKALLCCLGIDTRNILFTGQKKQPVIVPMYAAGLGMLEPTKEPVKPVSAAEMIASIAQGPPGAADKSSCPSDSVQQEALPPVQFDWSSSGLTNPLDGVDPELYELTTSKLDPSGSGSRVADAFARLMSTMERTSTSTRKPKKDENLSEEAAKVIAALPDLSFMHAKVLMFPATLTPLGSRAMPD